MAASTSTNLATALLGAAGGALALYLFDPKSGKQRRERLSAVAEEALGNARQHFDSLTAATREQAARVGNGASSRAADAVRPLREAAKERLSDAADVASGARDVVARLVEQTQTALDEMRHRGRNAVSALGGEEPSTGVLPIAITAAGFCAAGVGLMWLMDPDRGRARRAQVSQQAHHILNQTSRAFHGTGRHLRNKFKGAAAVAERNIKERLAPEERSAATD